jgi:UDP-N-acetylglucosamine acyltransferase
MSIHPSAIIASNAELGAYVTVGPWSVIEDGVKVGDGSVIGPRVHLSRGTVLGKNCQIHMNAVVGYLPQDFSYKGEPLSTVLGDNVTLRENVTVHGSVEGATTRIGDSSYLMVGSHVAHNCQLGKNVILANGALLAGYVVVGDYANISGNVVIHQFVRIGTMAILSGGSRFGMDVPPYLVGDGSNTVTTLNRVGLRRSKVLNDTDRLEIKKAYKLLYRSGLSLKEALQEIKAHTQSSAVLRWVEFFEAPSKRGFCRYCTGSRRKSTTTSLEASE